MLDLYSRRVVSWAFSNQPNSELSVRAINLAVQLRQPLQPILFHTDQGVQYSSDAFREALTKHNITASMSRRGNCLDNAVTERFFRSLKSERVNYKQYKTRAEGMADIADYIESFYNQKRRHSTLGNMSPVEYEARQKMSLIKCCRKLDHYRRFHKIIYTLSSTSSNQFDLNCIRSTRQDNCRTIFHSKTNATLLNPKFKKQLKVKHC